MCCDTTNTAAPTADIDRPRHHRANLLPMLAVESSLPLFHGKGGVVPTICYTDFQAGYRRFFRYLEYDSPPVSLYDGGAISIEFC